MKTLTVFANMIRWKNLLLLFFSLFLFKYRLFVFFETTSILSDFQFFIFLISVLFIALGGYLINDYFDIECDLINKPEKVYVPNIISKSNLIYLYTFITAVGVSAGIYLSLILDRNFYALIFIGIAFLLFIYSYRLKAIAIIGNITIATLIAYTTILLLLIDTDMNVENQGVFLLLLLAVFSFLLNFQRELVKDIEDIQGDYKARYKTLPIILGIERTVKIILTLSVLPLYLLIDFIWRYFEGQVYVQIFGFFFIIIPYIFFCYTLHKANHKKEFHQASSLLKFILASGLLLILLTTI